MFYPKFIEKVRKITCESKKNKNILDRNLRNYPAINYLFKVNNRNARKSCEICSKLTIKTPERPLLSSLLFALNIFHTFFSVSLGNANKKMFAE